MSSFTYRYLVEWHSTCNMHVVVIIYSMKPEKKMWFEQNTAMAPITIVSIETDLKWSKLIIFTCHFYRSSDISISSYDILINECASGYFSQITFKASEATDKDTLHGHAKAIHV